MVDIAIIIPSSHSILGFFSRTDMNAPIIKIAAININIIPIKPRYTVNIKFLLTLLCKLTREASAS